MTATVGDSSTRRQLSPPTRRVVTVLDAHRRLDPPPSVATRSLTLCATPGCRGDDARDRRRTRRLGLGAPRRGRHHRRRSGLVATASRVLGADRLTASARPVLADLANALQMPVFLARRIDEGDSDSRRVRMAACGKRGYPRSRWAGASICARRSAANSSPGRRPRCASGGSRRLSRRTKHGCGRCWRSLPSAGTPSSASPMSTARSLTPGPPWRRAPALRHQGRRTGRRVVGRRLPAGGVDR